MAEPTNPRTRFLTAIVPVMLITVALAQITAAHTADLTPWKGGGFGMFTQVDDLTHRSVFVVGHTASGEEIALTGTANVEDTHYFIKARATRVSALPDTRSLERLATQILALRIYRSTDPSSPTMYSFDEDSGELVEFTGLSIQVRGLRFDPEARTVELRLIREYRTGSAKETPDAGN